MIVGRIEGVCAGACGYVDGVCARCHSLDPHEFIVIRLPSKETAEGEAITDELRKTAERLGIDVQIVHSRGVAARSQGDPKEEA